MNKQTILIEFQSSGPLPGANKLTAFVAGAVDAARANMIMTRNLGLLTDATAATFDKFTNCAMTTSAKTAWKEKYLAEVGTSLQDRITAMVMDKMGQQSGTQACRDFANELIHVFMRSEVTDADARALYESLPDA